MSLLGILFIAIALSFDAMAVAAASGARYHHMSFMEAVKIAIFFGIFQGLMPLIGWAIGTGLEKIISNFDHWVAFILLSFIGLKMIIEAIKKKGGRNKGDDNVRDLKTLIILATATSIDALIVGVTFAILPINIWLAITVIGLTTFILSLLSIYLGKTFGKRWGKKAEIIGGLILIIIGAKILIEHLFF